MRAIERIWKSLNHEEPDRIPTFSQTIENPFIERFDEEIGIEGKYELYDDVSFEVVKQLGLDSKWKHTGGITFPSENKPIILNPEYAKKNNLRVNVYGSIHQYASDGSNWYVGGGLNTPDLISETADYLKQGEPTIIKYEYFQDFWERALAKDIVPIPTAGGINCITWEGIGMNRLSQIARKHPMQLRALIDSHTQNTILQHNELFSRMGDYPMCFICDDYAQKGRLMMNPKLFDDFFGPGYTAIAKNAHKHGAKMLMHSDGDLMESLSTLKKAGFDAIEPLEYEAGMRISKIRYEFPKDFCLIGNIPASDALCIGTKEDTIRYVLQAILDVDGCGTILGQGANMLATSKLENVIAMIATINEYGTYPIDRNRIEKYLNSL